ncbi:MAG: NAD-dependent epimerase/dehydratase family protein [Deltaproteobacteria bacterium]|nr:NAD-dependent epimerase/dehydratase family protein [Deltaproteobacteria bacterium]MBW2383616.1 NAD-dependent epimerase/dehydratase family protein [Deltaproteobacteria bacterium]MBW2697394.1 NAD-dependent epimerase/dehydratase family protein [Deltaproteobacteria bacterium]
MAGRPSILIAGAGGVVGSAALEHFSRLPDWAAVGLSRRRPPAAGESYLCVDLLDREACVRQLGALPDITHVIYAALFEKPGLIAGWRERDQMNTNLEMLRNLFDGLESGSPRLEHVSLLQGTKAYGAHVHPMSIPGLERAPRDEHPNFYWLQEDLLRERQSKASWSFTIWRPPIVYGHGIGSPMNLMAVIGVHGALLRARRRALAYPGGAGGPLDGVDARLLAQGFEWATDAEAARNETFNLTNGDVYVWENVWPAIAHALGMEVGAPEPQLLYQTLPAKANLWDRIVNEHRLQAPGLLELVGDSLIYADVLFNSGGERPPPPTLLSTVKIRQAGFAPCIDSQQMFVEWLERLQEMRVLPRR